MGAKRAWRAVEGMVILVGSEKDRLGKVGDDGGDG